MSPQTLISEEFFFVLSMQSVTFTFLLAIGAFVSYHLKVDGICSYWLSYIGFKMFWSFYAIWIFCDGENEKT